MWISIKLQCHKVFENIQESLPKTAAKVPKKKHMFPKIVFILFCVCISDGFQRAEKSWKNPRSTERKNWAREKFKIKKMCGLNTFRKKTTWYANPVPVRTLQSYEGKFLFLNRKCKRKYIRQVLFDFNAYTIDL